MEGSENEMRFWGQSKDITNEGVLSRPRGVCGMRATRLFAFLRYALVWFRSRSRGPGISARDVLTGDKEVYNRGDIELYSPPIDPDPLTRRQIKIS